MAIFYLALGSNLGDRAGNFREALARLAPRARVRRASPIYQTEPWGVLDQPRFLNQVVEAETDLPPAALMALIKQVENEMGRVKTQVNGPRLIDLDILFYGGVVYQDERLEIPHPRLRGRAFVFAPLADLAPDYVHPVLGLRVSELLRECDLSSVRRWGEPPLPFGQRTYVMGIINLTADSFSGDGLFAAEAAAVKENALAQARAFVAAGADLLDVGGESTRPGALPVSLDEELERVIPVIEALAKEVEAPISVDTYKAKVAEAALGAGARWLNDVWGLRADPEMAGVAARWCAPVVLMHNRSQPAAAELQAQLGGRYVGVEYGDLLEDVKAELMESVRLARAAGVADSAMLLDPGIGFGKTTAQNLELLNRLDEVRALGFPILLGVSRKSFIGYTLNRPPDQRREGTAAAVAIGIARGADVVRVHDVETMALTARMADAITRR